MTDIVQPLDAPSTTLNRISRRSGYQRQKRAFRFLAMFLLGVYSLVTLFPFYIMFIRTFVPTKETTRLHFWIPKQDPISLDADINNLATYYNFDLKDFKAEMGIKGYINPGTSLRDLSEQFNIPEEKLLGFFNHYGVFTGWYTLLFGKEFWNALLRSVIITVSALVLICALSIMTGYGLAGLRRRDQMLVYNLYLLEMVIPAMLIIVPQFLLIQNIQSRIPGMGEQGWGRWSVQLLSIILILAKGGAFSTMIFTSAISAIPREMEESAQVDGATRWQYLRYILLPLLKVPIATAVVILLPDFWNRFLEPFVYLDPPNNSLLPMITNLTGRFTTNFQITYTGVFLSILPLVVVYLIFRRWFIRGVMSGAIKG